MSRRWRRLQARVRTRLTGAMSLRLRLMLGAASLAALFMLALLPALQGAFSLTFEKVIEQRLAADASTLITAAQVEGGRLQMPERLPDEEFDLPDAQLLGFIYDRRGELIWHSRSAADERIDYRPRYEGGATEFLRVRDADGVEYFVYDVELHLAGSRDNAFSFVTMQPTSEYLSLFEEFRRQLYLWLGSGLLVLLALLWLGLTWGFRTLKRVSAELDQVEAGQRERLSDDHPRELLRLTRSLNRLLDSERRQREQYRNSLGDLAHSLKTPLSVLQGVGETLGAEPEPRAGARDAGADRAHEPADRLSAAACQPRQERPGAPPGRTAAVARQPVQHTGQGLSRQARADRRAAGRALCRTDGTGRADGAARQPAGKRLPAVPWADPHQRPHA